MRSLCRLLLTMAIVSCIFSYNLMNASWFSGLFSDMSSPEITQDDNNVIVRMNIPYNIDPYSVHVEIKEKTLHVYGKKERKHVKKAGYFDSYYFHSEISGSSSFSRKISLPCLVNEDESEATVSSSFIMSTQSGKVPESYSLRIVMPKAKSMIKKIKVFVLE